MSSKTQDPNSRYNPSVTSKALAIFCAVLAILAGIAAFLLVPHWSRHEPSTLVSDEARIHGACPGETRTLEMTDAHMPRSFPRGSKFRLVWNWYVCHPAERGDFVYYRYSFTTDPVVRRVVAVPGDRFSASRDETHLGWNVSVNGSLVTDDGGTPHFFGAKAEPVLALYEKPLIPSRSRP